MKNLLSKLRETMPLPLKNQGEKENAKSSNTFRIIHCEAEVLV